MAFTNTETNCITLSAGASSIKLLVGAFTSAGGSTGGDIIPGNPSSGSAASGSDGMRSIIGTGFFTTDQESVTTVKSVKSPDATYDRDKLTITTAANTTGIYYILAQDAGA